MIITIQQVHCYLLLINALGLALMCLDKYFAKKHLYRIPEVTLLLVAGLGGSVGSWLGMYAFRHKTKHPKFFVGVPLILLVQIIACLLLRHMT